MKIRKRVIIGVLFFAYLNSLIYLVYLDNKQTRQCLHGEVFEIQKDVFMQCMQVTTTTTTQG